MTYPIANRKNQYYTPPRAYSPTGVGQEVVVPVSAGSAGYINLQVLVQSSSQVYNATQAQLQQQNGVVGHYITIYADGVDIGIVVGLSAAAVSGGAAPNLSTHGTVSPTGAYQGATGVCHRIPAGQERRYLLQDTQDLYMGYIGASGPTGSMRIFQSSPPLA